MSKNGAVAIVAAAAAAAGTFLLMAPPGRARVQTLPAGIFKRSRVCFVSVAKHPPKIDGVLDDEAWQWASAGGVLADTVTGKPGTVRTTFKACHDWNNLYVAFDCQDADVWSEFTRRDQPLWEAEVVEVFIDPKGIRKKYFEFEVSPRNVVWDGLITNPKGKQEGVISDSSWNCSGFRSAVKLQGTVDNRRDRDRGWTVEMAIPTRCIVGRRAEPSDRWEINFYRIERKGKGKPELLAWRATNVPYFHAPRMFGRIMFWPHEPVIAPPARGK